MQKTKSSTIIVILLILIAIALLALLASNREFGSKPPSFQSVPRAMSYVSSGSTGQKHLVTADVSLEMERATKAELAEIQTTVENVLANLDYDKISAADGIEYIKSAIKAELPGDIADEDINVYLTAFVTDYRLPEPVDTGVSDFFKGLFPNIDID